MRKEKMNQKETYSPENNTNGSNRSFCKILSNGFPKVHIYWKIAGLKENETPKGAQLENTNSTIRHLQAFFRSNFRKRSYVLLFNDTLMTVTGYVVSLFDLSNRGLSHTLWVN